MCGFVGWIDVAGPPQPPPSDDRLRAALSVLAPRGPDGEGMAVYPEHGVGLLHRRLAVVDLEGGAQPMPGPAPGQILAWNGELFDHRERRTALEATGASLRTRSDTEVLAHLLDASGAGALPGLRAQYALAWITGLGGPGRPRLLLARDPAGEKPLFWTLQGRRLWFGSTLEALAALAPLGRALDAEALSLYLSWGFVPAPRTILEGVHKLRAGHRLEVGDDGIPRTALVPAAPAAPPESATLHDVLGEASRLRLESSDVPVGVFLSGGLDSLAVTAVLRDHPGLETYTVRSDDPAFDESRDAARVAHALGVSHHVIDPPGSDPDRWREVFHRYGEPFGTTSALAVDAVARAAREHVKVVLTGDGGDEALGGYPRHVLLRRLARVPRLPGTVQGLGRLRRLRRAAELLSLDASDRFAALYEVFGPWRERLVPGDGGQAARDRIRGLWAGARADDLDAMLRVDRALELPDSHCVKVDVACMGNGVEARSPWLDRQVIAFCDALPIRDRIRGGSTKRVLRELVARELPKPLAREVLRRPKRGFNTGFDALLRAPDIRDLLLGDSLDRIPGLRRGAVADLLAEHGRGEGNHLFRLGVLVGLALFADRHL